MSIEFVFFLFLLFILVAIFLSITVLRITVGDIEEKIKTLYYKIDKANSTLDIVEKKVDRIENVRLISDEKIRKVIENFCKEIGDHENN